MIGNSDRDVDTTCLELVKGFARMSFLMDIDRRCCCLPRLSRLSRLSSGHLFFLPSKKRETGWREKGEKTGSEGE